MSFYLNYFPEEYVGLWSPNVGILKKGTLRTFRLPPNLGRSKTEVCSNANSATFDLSSTDENGINTADLYIAYSLDSKNYKYISIAISGATPAATTPLEIVAALNANSGFANFFTASLKTFSTLDTDVQNRISISTADTRVKFFMPNCAAERILKFNKYAGIALMPSFFLKDNINYNVVGVYNGEKGIEDLTFVEPLSRNISSNTVANPTIVTCPKHGLKTGTTNVTISGSNSTPTIDGTRVATYVSEDTFSVPVNVTVAGNDGFFVTDNAKAIIADAVDKNGTNLGYLYTQSKKDVYYFEGDSNDLYATHAPAAATAAVVTIPAVENRRIRIKSINWSYSAAPTGGALTVVSDSVTLLSIAISAAGNGVSYASYVAPENKSMVITLASGAGAVVGILSVEYYYNSDE
jgi:hypothetical protein